MGSEADMGQGGWGRVGEGDGGKDLGSLLVFSSINCEG